MVGIESIQLNANVEINCEVLPFSGQFSLEGIWVH